jgi:hypothetical protein
MRVWLRSVVDAIVGRVPRGAIKVYLLGSLFIAGGISVGVGWQTFSRWLTQDIGPFAVSYVETYGDCVNRLEAQGVRDLRECLRSRAGGH